MHGRDRFPPRQPPWEDEPRQDAGCLPAVLVLVVVWTIVLGCIWAEATIWKWVWRG